MFSKQNFLSFFFFIERAKNDSALALAYVGWGMRHPPYSTLTMKFRDSTIWNLRKKKKVFLV
jgi:hypothetical protein